MKIDGPELKGVDRTVQTESMPDILDDGQLCLIINTVMRKNKIRAATERNRVRQVSPFYKSSGRDDNSI